ncbi:zinc metalloproteinase dpy-31-like [Lineus longissimus]|uniref:zinc metalloproteinase dpy-31-like n=1 Tax=Lineus longissimus TaxID=88925 RepID=UPI00315CE70D
MRSLSIAALLLLLMVLNVHCRSLNNGVNEEIAETAENIKRLLALLEKQHDGTERSNDEGDDRSGEKHPYGSKDNEKSGSEEEGLKGDLNEREAIIKHEQVEIRQMESFLKQERKAVPGGAIDPNETDETKLHNRIQQLEKEIRREEDTVHIRNGKVTKVRTQGEAPVGWASLVRRTKLDDVLSMRDSDDILYTPEQLAAMQSTTGKRRLYEFVSWPDKVIPYQFESTFSQSSDQAKVVNAMRVWESVSCVKFRPRISTDTDYYLRITPGTGCSSAVGRVRSDGGGQNLFLALPGCVRSAGTILHELGHAMGFFHEQSRLDRDDSVSINFDNIESGRERNFFSERSELVAQYDVESIMHYGSHFFSKNGLATIDAKEQDESVLMGNRVELTFYDKKVANRAYECADHCNSSAPACTNDGYLNMDCVCVCPKGLGGAACETSDPTWDSICGGMFSLDDGDEVTLESPGFPGVYPAGLQCAWIIESKRADSLVVLNILTLNNEYLGSCSDTLEIRKNLLGQTGIRFCGSNPDVVPDANRPIFNITTKPNTQSMSVLFESSPTSHGMTKGFKAIAKIARRQTACTYITCPGESLYCEDQGSSLSHTCVCKTGWAGSDCDISVITTEIITEDFESSTYSFDIVEPWRLNQRQTLSGGTGPSGDFTSSSGYYVYFESSAPLQYGEMHQMISSTFFDGTYYQASSWRRTRTLSIADVIPSLLELAAIASAWPRL